MREAEDDRLDFHLIKASASLVAALEGHTHRHSVRRERYVRKRYVVFMADVFVYLLCFICLFICKLGDALLLKIKII